MELPKSTSSDQYGRAASDFSAYISRGVVSYSVVGAWAPTTWVRKALKSLTWARKCVKSEEKSLNFSIMMVLCAVFIGSAPTTHFAKLRPCTLANIASST